MTWPVKSGWYVVHGIGDPEVVYVGSDPRAQCPADDVGKKAKVWRAGQEYADNLSEYDRSCEWKFVRLGDVK